MLEVASVVPKVLDFTNTENPDFSNNFQNLDTVFAGQILTNADVLAYVCDEKLTGLYLEECSIQYTVAAFSDNCYVL